VALPYVPHDRMADREFLSNTSWLYYVVYMVICTSAARFKYFFAWKLGETICNASGLGFGGFTKTKDGQEKADWDLVSNLDIWKLETSLNFKILLDNWNKSTQSWLRRCAYERTTKNRTVITYILSALWHGFYPGYYLCFLTGALVTTAARSGRRCLRPHFKGEHCSKNLGLFYDVVTFVLTRVYLAYTVAPFVLLSLESGLQMYAKQYFFGHLLCLVAIFIVPVLFPLPKRDKVETRADPNDNSKVKSS